MTSLSARGPADLVPQPRPAIRVAEALAAGGHPLWLVGGSVRDALMGRGGGDLDFTTDARPEQVLALTASVAAATWTTGIEFGTVGVLVDSERCEITTYRADRYDRVTRNPEVVFGESLVEDLRRRDFTMNAMAVRVAADPAEREFVDPFGGLADLARGLLRTPGDPSESFADDPLRILRAARFVSTLGVDVPAEVREAMTNLAPELARITPERVQVELSKLLLGAHPRRGLELLVDTGAAEIVLPELPALRMAADEHGQHKDVYAHTLQVLEQAIEKEATYTGGEPDLVLRLAALLHDVGKPATRRFESGGRVTFHHHEVVGKKLTQARLQALRFPKDVVKDVSKLVFLHLRFYGYGRGEWTDSAVRRYVTDAGPLLPKLSALVRSDSTTRNRRKAAALDATYDALEERIEALKAQEELDAIRPDLDGHQIMALLPDLRGRAIGEAYQHLLALRMEHGPLGEDRAREELLAWWAAQQD
ncbi:CCA tRNA nucleotidyltransferase [Jatrophihabitans sp. YIM 134969]